jgi:hypothetical protein
VTLKNTLDQINGVVGLEHFFLSTSKGRSTTGKVILHGARVGDTVVMVVNMTDATNKSARFEGTISVADQIQQTSAADNLSAKDLLFIISR